MRPARYASEGVPGAHSVRFVSQDWQTRINDVVTRTELKDTYGGAPFGGIEPSAQTPNVLVFMDPEKAKENGYLFDGWTEDGSLLYTGEGRFGDQLMREGNRAIADHTEDGRALRVFTVAGTVPNSEARLHRYLGEFRVDAEQPYTIQEARDKAGDLRTVFVFKLWPLDDATPHEGHLSDTGAPPQAPKAQEVDLEFDQTLEFATAGSEPTTAQKREAQLVARFKAFRGKSGNELKRFKIRPAGDLSYQLTDVYDPATKTLYEAKGTTTRESVRMAVGQLLDYRRHIPSEVDNLAILLPHRPSDDLCAFVSSLAMQLTYEAPNGRFTTLVP